MKEELLKFLQEKQPKLCVISTVSKEGKPESAVVGFAAEDDLSLLASTKKDTRKAANIRENNKVSVVIGWSFTEMSVQYEGTAQLIEEGSLYTECEQKFFSANPAAAKFKTPETIFIKITPTWIRVSDTTVHPAKIDELTF